TGSLSGARIESRGNHAACVLTEGKDPGECRPVLATRSGRTTSACEREYEKSAAEYPAAKAGCRPACAYSRHAWTQRSVCEDHGHKQQLMRRGARCHFEIGRILISDPKSEIPDRTVQFTISDLGFERQDSSNFKMPFVIGVSHEISTRFGNHFHGHAAGHTGRRPSSQGAGTSVDSAAPARRSSGPARNLELLHAHTSGTPKGSRGQTILHRAGSSGVSKAFDANPERGSGS